MSGLEKPKSDVVEQFTAQVDRFVTSPHVNQPEPVARYVATVAPRGDERALDVGCGPELLAKAFAPRVREYVGVDLTPAMVAKAADIARAAGIANARFEVGDALALPFEPASFDLALSRLALHHMSDPRGAIQQMARALRPGGRLALFDMITSEVTEESAYHNLVERLRDPEPHARAPALGALSLRGPRWPLRRPPRDDRLRHRRGRVDRARRPAGRGRPRGARPSRPRDRHAPVCGAPRVAGRYG